MPPDAWLGSNQPWLEVSPPSSQPPPPSPLPQQQPPPPLESEEGDALLGLSAADLFAHALSLALGAEEVQAAAPSKRAAAGGAAADRPSVQPMASKRTRHT